MNCKKSALFSDLISELSIAMIVILQGILYVIIAVLRPSNALYAAQGTLIYD